jgi:hypothetical protein
VRLGVAEGATREQKRRGVCSGRNHSASSHRIGTDRAAPATFIPEERSMRRSLAAFLAAGAMAVVLAAPASAAPDNDQTLHFELTCDDGTVYQASFNGGPVAFHLDTGGLYIWKEIQFVTPTGESGVLTRGLKGFAAEPTVTCTYIGAVSGNHYTVIGFYPEK